MNLWYSSRNLILNVFTWMYCPRIPHPGIFWTINIFLWSINTPPAYILDHIFNEKMLYKVMNLQIILKFPIFSN